jgi:hypothetical protein
MPRLHVPVTERDHQRGPPRASVTLVEYGDFQCPRSAHVLRDLERFEDDVRFIYRHFPLPKIHPLALIAAEASEAAAGRSSPSPRIDRVGCGAWPGRVCGTSTGKPRHSGVGALRRWRA